MPQPENENYNWSDLSLRWLNNLLQTIKDNVRRAPRLLSQYFINGIIVLIPLVVTIWILVWFFNLIDGMLSWVFEWVFGRHMPGLGFAIIILLVLFAGFFAVKAGHRKMFGYIEKQILRLPLIGAIYGGARQIIDSFTGANRGKFLEVVFLEFPRKGIYTIGLVTHETINESGQKTLNVFIPTVPNPTSGFLQIVSAADVVHTSMPIREAFKLIISAGRISGDSIGNVIVQVPRDGGEKVT